MKTIAILIPCHNEEHGIARVINGLPAAALRDRGYITKVVVIDNNSTDKTAEVATSHGAEVIVERAKGKGNALIAGFKHVQNECDYVVIIDGDNTYKLREVMRLIEPLESGFCDVVAGSRLSGKTKAGSLTFSHRVVNWAFAFFVRQFYQSNVTDVLTGFIAMKADVVRTLIPNLKSTNFTIEMEMITKLNKLDFEMYSVPITYDQRIGTSKVESLADGARILMMFVNNLAWHPIKGSTMNRLKKRLNITSKAS